MEHICKRKSFWQQNDYPYIRVVEINEDTFVLLVHSLTREDIIEWLMWNDPNGVYEDSQSLKELGNIITREEALEIMFRQVEENRSAN